MRKIVNSTYISLDGVVEQPHLWPTIDRPSDERGVAQKGTATEAFSWLESALSGGTAAGAALAGALTQHYGSDKTFLAAGVFAAGALLVAWARLATIHSPDVSQHKAESAPNPEPATF